MDIISFLFDKPEEPKKPVKTELETTLETARKLSLELGFSTTEVLLAQLLINHEKHKSNL